MRQVDPGRNQANGPKWARSQLGNGPKRVLGPMHHPGNFFDPAPPNHPGLSTGLNTNKSGYPEQRSLVQMLFTKGIREMFVNGIWVSGFWIQDLGYRILFPILV